MTRREERQEGEVHEENDGLRAQTTPLLGTRPAPWTRRTVKWRDYGRHACCTQPQAPVVQTTPLSLRRVYPMVQTVCQTWDFPVASHDCRCPCCAGRTGSLFRGGAEASSMVQTVCLTVGIPQLLITVADVPVARSCSSRVHTWRRQSSSHSCTRCGFLRVGQLIIALMS